MMQVRCLIPVGPVSKSSIFVDVGKAKLQGQSSLYFASESLCLKEIIA